MSGSGKSTLVNDILYNVAGQQAQRRPHGARAAHDASPASSTSTRSSTSTSAPIGRTPRSNPATYTGVFDHIRKLFAATTEAKMRGYQPGRFSFNVKGGRCEACSGDGTIKIEMNFLPDVYVPCEVCHGARYNRETLEVHYKGKTIAEVLDMPIEEAADFFAAVPAIARHLQTLVDVGLGYVRLGQPAPTLSGGEAQRVKLATELQKRSTGRTVYVLDEPTTGLHFEDIRKLLGVLQAAGRQGQHGASSSSTTSTSSRRADWIIDMGPEGGTRRRPGGRRGHARGGRRRPEQLTPASSSRRCWPGRPAPRPGPPAPRGRGRRHRARRAERRRTTAAGSHGAQRQATTARATAARRAAKATATTSGDREGRGRRTATNGRRDQSAPRRAPSRTRIRGFRPRGTPFPPGAGSSPSHRNGSGAKVKVPGSGEKVVVSPPTLRVGPGRGGSVLAEVGLADVVVASRSWPVPERTMLPTSRT